MRSMMETLEGRRLLAGHGVVGLLGRAEGSEDPAVQATVALIQSDQAAIEAARQQIVSDSTDTRSALKDVVKNGFELLGSDRQAIRDAQDDPEALQAAKDKFKADRTQIRTDIIAARDAVRDDTADGQADLKTALQSLADHLKQLKTDLQNAGEIPTRPKPDENGNYAVTPEQAAKAVDKINAIASEIENIDQAAVDKLTADITSAASDSSITSEERETLGQDVRAVISSLNFRDLGKVFRELRAAVPTVAKLPFHG